MSYDTMMNPTIYNFNYYLNFDAYMLLKTLHKDLYVYLYIAYTHIDFLHLYYICLRYTSYVHISPFFSLSIEYRKYRIYRKYM